MASFRREGHFKKGTVHQRGPQGHTQRNGSTITACKPGRRLGLSLVAPLARVGSTAMPVIGNHTNRLAISATTQRHVRVSQSQVLQWVHLECAVQAEARSCVVAGLSLGPMVVRVWRSIFLHVFAINTSQTKQPASSMALCDFCRIFWGVLVMRATPLWKKRGPGLRVHDDQIGDMRYARSRPAPCPERVVSDDPLDHHKRLLNSRVCSIQDADRARC